MPRRMLGGVAARRGRFRALRSKGKQAAIVRASFPATSLRTKLPVSGEQFEQTGQAGLSDDLFEYLKD